MKISVITCTYNRKDKLKKNINSVIEQNYNNYEHLIVDDGSTDGTEDFINNNKFDNLIFLKNSKNKGQPAVLFESNVFDKATGDIIIILDSDDYLLPNAFKTIEEDFKKFSNLKIISINYDWLESNNNNTKIEYNKYSSHEIFKDHHPRNINKNGFRDYLIVRKKEYYQTIKKYFLEPKYWYASYYDFCIENNFYEIFTNKCLYVMTFEEDTVTRGFNINKYAKWSLFTREYVYTKYKDKMDKNYFKYTLVSLINNYLVNSKSRIKILKIIFKEINFFVSNPFFLISTITAFCIPPFILLKLKKYLKFKKKTR